MKTLKCVIIFIIALVAFIVVAGEAVPAIVQDVEQRQTEKMQEKLYELSEKYNCWPLEVFDEDPTPQQIERSMKLSNRSDLLYMTKPEIITSTEGMVVYSFTGTTISLLNDGEEQEHWIRTIGGYIYAVKRQ